MRLTILAATLGLLQLVSLPLFAAQTKPEKDYKDATALILPTTCITSPEALILNHITQNNQRALPNLCKPFWFKQLAISGGINADAGKWGDRNANVQGENYQHFAVNDAYLNIAAALNDWINLFGSFSVNSATVKSNPAGYKNFGAAEYSASYSNNVNRTANNHFQVEQAFATIGNATVFPVFFQFGKQYQDFSRYNIHPITYSMTQVMSEILAPSAKIGFIEQGFNGSLYVFQDPLRKFAHSAKPTNYGIAFGYDEPSDIIAWDIGAAYVYNMIGANNVAYQVANFSSSGGFFSDEGFYHRRVGAIAFYADSNAGPFGISARYTQAVQRFSVYDLPKHGVADLSGGVITGVPVQGTHGAQPWALDVQSSYTYTLWDKKQSLFIGYQTSRQAAGLDLPKHRSVAAFGIDVYKDINLTAEWDHDWLYSVSEGGNGKNTNLFSVRAAFKFV